jgi:hypothetical protein
MKGIVKFGLVIGVLLCGAVGVASAQEEFSEDYKEGFYTGALLLVQAVMDADYLSDMYFSLDGQPTDETVVVDNETITWSDFYNEEATYFNENAVPQVNGFIEQVFGPDDERTEQLSLKELPLIT